MSAIYLICTCATFFGTHELNGMSLLMSFFSFILILTFYFLSEDVIKDNTEFFKSLKGCFKHKSYIILSAVFLFNILTVDVLQTNIA